MPGGLLDLFGIDPIANRQRREKLELQKLENQGRLDVAKLGNTGQMDVAKLNNAAQLERLIKELQNRLDTVKATGEENRKTGEREQALNEMSKLGLISKAETPNEKTADQALTDPTIRGVLQQRMGANAVRATPDWQNSLAAGMNAQNLMPAFENMSKGTQRVGVGDMAVIPPSGAQMPPDSLSAWRMMQGATTGMSETVENTPQIMTMPNGQQMSIPGQPKVIRNQTMMPGRIKLPQQILDAANAQQPAQNGGIQAMPQSSMAGPQDYLQLLYGNRY